MSAAPSPSRSPSRSSHPSLSAHRLDVLLVTGMSGAGRSSALKALEDMGYEAVDNVPLSLWARLARPLEGLSRPLAIGVDLRTRDFTIRHLMDELDELTRAGGVVKIVFLDCDDDVLIRRFTETRRRHPLAIDRPIADGIRHERQLLIPLRERADLVIDTSRLSLGDLQHLLHADFAPDAEPGLTLVVTSFSFRQGLPRGADLVFDVRFLANPHYQDKLRPLSGKAPSVVAFIEADPGFESFFSRLTDLLESLLPRYEREGKSYLTIAFGCTGGRHRSVFVAEKLASWLMDQGRAVTVTHRDMDPHGV